MFAAVVEDREARALLARTGRSWAVDVPLVAGGTESGSSVWRADDGSRFLPFSPDEPLVAMLKELYVDAEQSGRRMVKLARSAYYRARPLLPRSLQLAARRRYAKVQDRAGFPSWPAETALHRLHALTLGWVEEVFGEPVPWIAPWPRGFEWATVLTHDVEREAGYRHVGALVHLEQELGVRSAFYFVPERDYRVDEVLLAALREDGFEVALHGLRHDGRDMDPGVFDRRLPAMRRYAEEWGAVGFRAPATHRGWDIVARLGVEHDSSYSDVARYEPQAGGSCSWLPFFIGEVVELPITMPMDHTLFELLRCVDDTPWREKAGFLRSQGGMAMLLTHPDYLLTRERLGVYREFLRWLVDDRTCWRALPRDVAGWWRRRAASRVEYDGDWIVTGAAAEEAVLRLGAPTPPPAVS
jgi:hypothetical protein